MPSETAPQNDSPDRSEPRTRSRAFRFWTAVLTLAMIVLVLYVTARLLVAQGDDVPPDPANSGSASIALLTTP